MIWLVLAAIVGVYLAGIGTGVGLAKAAARGDRRGGYLEIPPFVQVGGEANVQATGRSLGELGSVLDRIRPYTGDEGQSAA